MKKVLISLSIIGVVAAIVIGATTAYFSDTETSTGNTFTAGAIDLKIDFDGYLNKIADGTPNAGTWDEKDLVVGTDKFFYFTDLKPGDFGEGTISLHVYDNDAWGKMVIESVVDAGNTCVDPETEVQADVDCWKRPVNTPETDGELRENLTFSACLDQGTIPGFQCPANQPKCPADPTEGDNICQTDEPVMITPGTIDLAGETHEFWGALAAYRASIESQCANSDPDGDGHANYGICQGIARDGRLVGSTSYQLAVMWNLPYATGNEAQSDTLQATIKFQAVQHRNNLNHDF
ncbi:MAG: hypothetical protein Athens101410_581 [Parcubacteria group bacterium Athens1014_10]|nr:MAG: hypothetical protein Athens101410_581 [Parcubacteria group bacterium Athens1014_10]TSD04642.1 MAG: hypothetical protein Athens071412_709 [Parcubacteria group bacterium Athens0714_12]